VSRVSVAGSLHLDIMVEAPRLPLTDETLPGRSWSQKCGGKGGNQAVAAARFGASCVMGGRVGDDDFGRRLREHLRQSGVDDSCVGTDPVAGSGMSVAIQEASGEYGAVIVSGANLAIDANTIARDWASLWRADILMLQNEVPETVNLAAAEAARAGNGRVLLNAAPARSLPAELLQLTDILVVNRVEAGQMTGQPVQSQQDVARAAQTLHRPGLDLIITLGSDGLHLTTRAGKSMFQPAFEAVVRSAHGAGDCFCGALAARLALGEEIVAASSFARAAAALFVAATPDGQRALSAEHVSAFLKAAEKG
jgi:ribokinase